jgi:hypothetical protein
METTPLFIRPAGKSPAFTISEATRLLRGDDFTYNRLKGCVQRRLIHPRQGPGRTSPALFGVDDIAAAAVLCAFFDFGIADGELAGYASRACYAWDNTFNPPTSDLSPIQAALVGTASGQFWVFKLSTYHCDQTNARRIAAAVYDLDAPPPDASQYLPPSFLPRSTLTIALPPLLLPLTRIGQRVKADA